MMTTESSKSKVWTKPEVKRLGELKDVAQGTNVSTGNGTMS